MFEADLHTHTVASTHAFGTVIENATYAAKKGLKIIAISDHGPAHPGAADEYYFLTQRVLPMYIEGVRVLHSIEANLMDEQGGLDVRDRVLASLDIVMAGVHRWPGQQAQTIEWQTRGTVAMIENPLVHVISHPGGHAIFPEPVVLAATRCRKALELNNNSFVARASSIAVIQEVAELCAVHGTYVSIASDAHSPFSIGAFEQATRMALDAGIKPEQIINRTVETLRDYLAIHGKDLAY